MIVVSCFQEKSYPIISMTSENSYIKIIDRGAWEVKDKTLFDLKPLNEKHKIFIRDMWVEYHDKFDDSTWFSVGPDSTYREIEISYNNQKIKLMSWHPIFEENPKLVVTSKGVKSLDGQNREDVLKSGSSNYLKSRNHFDKIYETCFEYKK